MIDTPEYYGTEELVGEAIRGFLERVFLATKASPRNFKYADLLRAADGSLLRLRVDHIDLYQLHWPNYTVPIEETIGAMEKLVDRARSDSSVSSIYRRRKFERRRRPPHDAG